MNRVAATTATGAMVLAATLAGCGDSGSQEAEAPASTSGAIPAETGAETSPESTAASSAAAGAGLGPDADLSKQSPSVAPKDAISTAQDEVGKGTVTSIELDFNERAKVWQYEIKIQDGKTENDVEIDAESGEVMNTEKDDTDDKAVAVSLDKPMTYDEALKLAQEKGSGRLEGWKLENDDKRTEYQFDFDDQGREIEVAVDVESKKATVDD